MLIKHLDLFPTRVWVFDLPQLAQSHPRWIARAKQWRSEVDTGGRSNFGGWSSDRSLFHTAEFADLGRAAIEVFSAVIKALGRPGETAFRIEGWINILDQGAINLPHIHGDCLLSAVYYLQAPEGASPLYFRDPRPGVALIPSHGAGVHNGEKVAVTPVEGQIVVFPSWLEHGVLPNESAEPRISIAINAVREGHRPAPGNG